MTTTSYQLSLLSANLDFDNHGGPYKDKTYSTIAKFLLFTKPTFLALQEVGDNRNGLKTKELELTLKQHGYDMISPEIDGMKPVNTRLFYDSNNVSYFKGLSPEYKTAFKNRQSGAIFKTKNNDKTIAVYSLHFPLYITKYQDNSKEKNEMWDKYINFAYQASKIYDHVILAGDFNESLINPTHLANKLIEISCYMVVPATTYQLGRVKNLTIFSFHQIAKLKTIRHLIILLATIKHYK